MAESQFYAILTDQGAALEATALATGIPVTLDKFVIGDGGGNAVTPDPTRTTLVNEVYRGTIKKAESQDNQVTFTLYVPPEAGGYTIREAGILTADGTLYSLSNSPDVLKPTESNGAVISITYKYTLAVSSTSTITVIINNDYLTPDDADKKYLQIEKNLSEIKDKGADAQKMSRESIGVNLDNYYTKEEIDNVNPVKTVNNIPPDDKGNVNTGTGVDLSDYYTKEQVDALFTNESIPTPGAIGTYALVSVAALTVTYGIRVNGSYLKYASIVDGGRIVNTQNQSLSGVWTILSDASGSTELNSCAVLAVRTA